MFVYIFSLFFQDDGQGLNHMVGGSDWTNIIIPGEASNSGFHHEKAFILPDLTADAQYECLVQAKNRYGWSEASRIHRFFTHTNAYGMKTLDTYLTDKLSLKTLRRQSSFDCQ